MDDGKFAVYSFGIMLSRALFSAHVVKNAALRFGGKRYRISDIIGTYGEVFGWYIIQY